MRCIPTLTVFLMLMTPCSWGDEYLGNYSANPYNANSTSNPYGAGSPYRNDSPNNPYGQGLEIYGE